MSARRFLVIFGSLCSLLAAPETTEAQTLHHAWSDRFGDASDQRAHAVTSDGSGNVIVAGYFWSTVDFGGGPLTNTSGMDVFVAKFDAAGAHLWSKSFGDTNQQFVQAITTDGSDAVLVAGHLEGTIDFGGGVLTGAGGNDVFIAKFDAAGNHIWSKSFGDADHQRVRSVATDGSDNVIVTGSFSGTVDFGGGPLTSSGSYDTYVAKFDAASSHLWSQRFGDADFQEADGVAVDGFDDVVIAGSFRGTVDFGGGVLTSASEDIFVAKFGATGNHLWSKRFGDPGLSQGANGITTDGLNNVIVTGGFDGTVDFGGGPLTSPEGNVDIFIAKFDTAGNHIWSDHFGYTFASGKAVTTDGSDNVIVTGGFESAVDFGGGPLMSGGGGDVFLAKFDAAGNHLWSDSFGDADNQYVYGITSDGSDNVIIAGWLRGTMDFGGGPLTCAGSYDVFVAKFGPVATDTGDSPVPAVSYLGQNHPNPFRRSTRIEFGLTATSAVSLKVYDVSGRLVRTLVEGRRGARAYEVEWDGKNSRGKRVASGIYFYRFTAGERTYLRKAVLVR